MLKLLMNSMIFTVFEFVVLTHSKASQIIPQEFNKVFI